MEFERQKPVTDEYREGWERLFSLHGLVLPSWVSQDNPEFVPANYPNGCPILEEERVDG